MGRTVLALGDGPAGLITPGKGHEGDDVATSDKKIANRLTEGAPFIDAVTEGVSAGRLRAHANNSLESTCSV